MAGSPPDRVGQGVAGLAQPRRQQLERQSGSGGRAGRRDRDRQRQPRAPVEDGPGRLRFAGHPVGPDPPREQVARLLLRQRVQAQRLGALCGDQGGELVPAGDDGQAAGRTGQQRADLLGVPGVVQHDQHPPRRQHAAVERGPGVEVGRDPGGGHPERAQEVGQHHVRVERRCARVEPAQVHVELAVRELPGDPVGPVHGEGGLAHTRHAGHRHDHHRRRGGGGRLPLRGEDGVEAGELVHPPGEAGDRERQLRRQRGGGVRRGHGRAVAEAVAGRARGPGAGSPPAASRSGALGLDAELLVEQGPQPLVGREGFLLPTGAVQRQHQLPVHGLLERMLPGQGLQLGHQPGGLAQRQPGVEQPLHRDQPQPLQPVRVLAEPVQPGHVGQRRPTPQGERRAVAGCAPRRVVALPGLLDQPLRDHDVRGLGAEVQPVARGLGEDRRLVAQHAAEVGDVALQGVEAGAPGPAPDDVDQPVRAHDVTGVQRERGQDGLAPQARHRTGDVSGRHVDRSEQPDLHGCLRQPGPPGPVSAARQCRFNPQRDSG